MTFAEGCKILNDTGDSYANWRYVNEVEYATLADNRPLIDQAVAVARDADLVILAIGKAFSSTGRLGEATTSETAPRLI